jgi:AraC-like DNA-binding protein
MSLSPEKRSEVALMLMYIDRDVYLILSSELGVAKADKYIDRVRKYIFALFHTLGLEKEVSSLTGIPSELLQDVFRRAYEKVRRELFEK